jgi:hypothetical protein
MQGEGSGYGAGNPYGQCIRCGLVYRLSDFRKEYTGARVCKDCVDPRPAELTPPRIEPEGLPRKDAQPRMPVVEQEPITGEDL